VARAKQRFGFRRDIAPRSRRGKASIGGLIEKTMIIFLDKGWDWHYISWSGKRQATRCWPGESSFNPRGKEDYGRKEEGKSQGEEKVSKSQINGSFHQARHPSLAGLMFSRAISLYGGGKLALIWEENSVSGSLFSCSGASVLRETKFSDVIFRRPSRDWGPAHGVPAVPGGRQLKLETAECAGCRFGQVR
jgi:hypothetical protein